MRTSVKSPMTSKRIWMTVCNILPEIMDPLEKNDITMDSRLTVELDMDTMDFIGILLKVNKNFELNLTSQEQLFPGTLGGGYLADPLSAEMIRDAEESLGIKVHLPFRAEEVATHADIFTVRLLCETIAVHIGVEWEDPE